MFHLTAPITKRQLELLQARKRLERRMSYDTLPANDYGLAAKVEGIDAELRAIEEGKGNREVAA
jgi:hypothetical protein